MFYSTCRYINHCCCFTRHIITSVLLLCKLFLICSKQSCFDIMQIIPYLISKSNSFPNYTNREDVNFWFHQPIESFLDTFPNLKKSMNPYIQKICFVSATTTVLSFKVCLPLSNGISFIHNK